MWVGLKSLLRRYLFAGLLIWIPIALTVWVLAFLVDTLDRTLTLLPTAWHTDALLGVHIPGMGLIMVLLLVLLSGLIASNFVGAQLVAWWDQLLQRIPVVKSIYSAIKQVSDALLSKQGQAFKQVVLVEYPQPNTWVIGFITAQLPCQIRDALPTLLSQPLSDEHTNTNMTTDTAITATVSNAPSWTLVFIPSSPSVTSGMLVMIPAAQVRPVTLSVDAALKMIISMGMIVPANMLAPHRTR
jgi:uncharacterized membrane protein